MILSLKRRRIQQEREAALEARVAAARDFVAAIREAEASLEAIKAANDKLYRSDVQAEQAILSDVRRSRERMFGFVAAKEVDAEAPSLTRLLGFRVAPTQAMPLVEWVAHIGSHDIAATGPAAPTPKNGA